jgi:hypothetical protein
VEAHILAKVLHQRFGVRGVFRIAATLACVAAGLLAPAAVAAPLPLTTTPVVDGPVLAVAFDGSGRTYLGGSFSHVGGQPQNDIARLNADGTLDTTWNPNETGSLVDALVASGSDVYVGGTFTSIGGQTRDNIAKLSTAGTGAADATWNPDAGAGVDTLAVSGSDLYVGGDFLTIGAATRHYLAKLSTTGTGAADATWTANATNSVRAIALSGSDLFVGGSFSGTNSIESQDRDFVAKVSTTGTGVVDATWDEPAGNTVFALAVSGASVYVGGTAGIAKLATAGRGSEDPIWGLPGANDTVRAIAASGSDLYVGGDFNGANSIGGQPRDYLAKLSTAGTGPADPVWDPSADAMVSALAVSGSRLAAGGFFQAVGPSTTKRIALFDIDAPVVTPPPQSPPAPAPVTSTGKRAAALKKCKKKEGSARKKCKKKAMKLPV